MRYYIAIGIDIGYKTLGIVIEQRYKDNRVKMLHTSNENPSIDKYGKSITKTSEQTHRVTEILHDIIDISVNSVIAKYIRLVVVEQQLPFAKQIIKRIDQHCISVFDTISFLYGITIQIVSMPSIMKYSILNGPLGASKQVRKMWAVKYMIDMLLLCTNYTGDKLDNIIDYIKALSDEAKDIGDAFILIESCLQSKLIKLNLLFI